jgi:hypothetical protein
LALDAESQAREGEFPAPRGLSASKTAGVADLREYAVALIARGPLSRAQPHAIFPTRTATP